MSFTVSVLGLEGVAGGLPVLEKNQGYAGNVAFAGARPDSQEIQFHLAQKDIHAGFNSGQTVNPVSHGHIAFRTSDLTAFKEHLEILGNSLFRLGQQGRGNLAPDFLL